ENSQKQTEDLGSQFTEIFIKQQENVTLLLTYLEEFDFHVRWPGVKLLTTLLKQQGPQVQQVILVSPMGVSRLMDLLADSREVIRNDWLCSEEPFDMNCFHCMGTTFLMCSYSSLYPFRDFKMVYT
ncbi:UNVERIFIED_CONTAM: Vesicle-mediated ER to Golgi transport protein, partial [Gekko kuhli]